MSQPVENPVQAVTLVTGAIARPEEPRHFMVIERSRGRVRATVGGKVVASSDRALVVKEVGRAICDPVVYFPPGDVRGELLTPVEGTTACPLKGTASYFDLELGPRIARGAWSYQRTHDFDRRLTELESCVAFDRKHVRIDIEDA